MVNLYTSKMAVNYAQMADSRDSSIYQRLQKTYNIVI